MRLYKVEVEKDAASEDQPRVAWAGTQADAKAAKRELAEAHGMGPLSKSVSYAEVDVPTDKAGLLQFLRDNVKE